jgi:hypothetical protein
MLTDQTGVLRGDEAIKVMGVNVAIQRETERSRQLEFLSITANPLDQQIIGPHGRAAVLRRVSQTIGLDGEEIVPSEDKLRQVEAEQEQMRRAELEATAAKGGGASPAARAQGSQAGPTATGDMGPRVKVSGGVG